MASASHQLRSLAHKLLNDSECAELKNAIQVFKKDKSVLMLCASLYKILTTPEKSQILLAIYPMIQEDLQSDFDSLCSLQFDYYVTALRPKIERYSAKNTKKVNLKQTPKAQVLKNEKSAAMVSIEHLQRFYTPREKKSAEHNILKPCKDEITTPQNEQSGKAPRHTWRRKNPDLSPRNETIVQQQRKRSKTAHAVLNAVPTKVHSPSLNHNSHPRVPHTSPDNSNDSVNSCQSAEQMPTCKNIMVRKVKLERRKQESLGFAIRGGADCKSGIYISEVNAGGQAERKGLRIGERILKVNDVTFKNVSHAEAVAVLKATSKLTIYVAPIGHMPGSTLNRTPRDICMGCSGSYRKESLRSGRCSCMASVSKTSGDLKKITVIADNEKWLGCSIRGGIDYDTEVTITNVDPGSPAYKAGLKKGQHIVKVNGVTVQTLTHEQVIDLITASNVIVFEVQYVASMKKSLHGQKLAKENRQCPARGALQPAVTSTIDAACGPCSEQINEHTCQDLEKELLSTPPVSTSTPLPPDNHLVPAANRQNLMNNTSSVDDATVIHLLQNGQQSQDTDSKRINVPTSETKGQNGWTAHNTKYRENKFDKGTIKLNMVEQDQKEIVKTAKIIDISVAQTNKMDRQRSHVKDIFTDNPKPPHAKSVRSESCRSPVRSPKTPQRDRSNSMNILSTPHSNKEMEQVKVTPSQNQLQAARRTASIQIQQELTGKRVLLSPNVPLTTSSPVANFLRKVLHTETGSPNNLSKSTDSLQSFGTGEISRHAAKKSVKKSNMPQISKWRSAYDFVAKSDDDDDDDD